MWQFILTGVLLTMISMMAVATITSFFSTIFQSTLMSTCAAFALIIIYHAIQSIVIPGQWLTGWLFIAHLNLLDNWSGAVSYALKANLTVTIRIIVLIRWSTVSIAMAAIYFKHKDMLNA